MKRTKEKTYYGLKRLLFYMKKNKGLFIIMVTLLIVGAGIGMAVPILQANVIGSISEKSFLVALYFAGALIGVRLLLALVWYFQNIYYSKIDGAVKMDIKNTLITSITAVTMKQNDKTSTGLYIDRINDDVGRCSDVMIDLITVLLELISNIGFLIYIAFLNIYFFISLIVYVGVLWLFDSKKESVWFKDRKKVKELREISTSAYNEQIRGLRDIKSLNIRKNTILDSGKKFFNTVTKDIRSRFTRGRYALGRNACAVIFEVGFIVMGILFIQYNFISLTNFLIIYMYHGNVRMVTQYIASIKAYAIEGELSSRRVFEIIDEYPKEGFGDLTIDNVKGKIIFKDVSFEEPTRFIFSHSALREGWDNPNVFQICTLKQSDSKISKRQEIGRGLRICRNWLYDLVDRHYTKSDNLFHKLNKLTVIATDSYKDFVSAFQNEMQDIIKDKPTQANEHFFEGKLLFDMEDNRIIINKEQARVIYKYLIKNDYIDDKDHITEQYRNDLSNQELKAVPEELLPFTESVHKLVQGVYNPNMLKGMIEDGNAPKKTIKTNKNFDRAEFQALWKEINHKYAYQVEFNSKELVEKAVNAINAELKVSELIYTVTWSEQRTKMEAEQLKKKDIFYGEKTRSSKISAADSDIEYDLVGKIASSATLTRKTVVEILSKIHPQKFEMFKANPEEFITKVSKLIEEQKATTLVEHIVYNVADGNYDNDIFTLQKTELEYETAQDSQKHILNKVFTDSDIEKQLAKDMEAAEEVVVYAKLPKAFYIPTPVGDYSPDWAIAFKDNKDIKHIYFIAETKGSLSSLDLRPIEKAKIECAKKLFNNMSSNKVRYDAITNYTELLSLIRA